MTRVTVAFVGVALLVASDTRASRPLHDYRYFRALSFDLQGRAPSRAEIAELESPGFDLDHWIETHMTGPTYAERIRRIYMDLLRLDLPPTVHFEPPSAVLYRVSILGPDARPVDLYFRGGQRRVTPELDGQVCFSEAEIGVKFTPSPVGTPKPVDKALFESRTVEVKPWWLYADYRSSQPKDLAGWDWMTRFPGFGEYVRLMFGPDGKMPGSIRVCREEAQTAETGHVYATGRIVTKKDKLLPGRTTRLPADTAYAKAHQGETISCNSFTAFQSTVDCGCGIGLERCMPINGPQFILPFSAPLDTDTQLSMGFGTPFIWMRAWWADEPRKFMDQIFIEDRDVRSLLTSRGSMINGPLAMFYRYLAGSSCCGNGLDYGYGTPDPLFAADDIPKDLRYQDAATWTWVPDRGPHAAGLMTMPIFLEKFGSGRARAHVIYQAFLCKDFVAETAKLTPSSEPDLRKRPGCASCHQTLEPLAAYFARVQDSDWTYLPEKNFPISLDRCTTSDPAKLPGACRMFYDPDFTSGSHTMLRGAYGSPEHANAGPPGLADAITQHSDFAGCVVKNVAQSLLGRTLGPDDEPWKAELTKTLVDNGYRMRPLVRAVLTSSRYREANDHMQEVK